MYKTLNHEPIKVCQDLCFRYKSVLLLLTNTHPGVALDFGIRTENYLLSSHTDLFILRHKQHEIAGAMDAYNYCNFQCQEYIGKQKSLLYYLYVIYG